MSGRLGCLLLAIALTASPGAMGCDDRAPAPAVRETAPDEGSGLPAAPARAYAPQGIESPPEPERTIQPAAHEDDGWTSPEPVEARRLVYRVTLRVPGVLGVAPATIPAPAAELFVDVSAERLRARFAGPGWPVEAGSEVRLRSDFPGTYVFDAAGGRPVPPGELPRWFQGGPVTHAQLPAVGLRAAPPGETAGPGDLICALLAEWSGQDRANLLRRCSRGAPAKFRLGPWRAERTADVPVQLPRHALRADHVDPPRPLTDVDSRAFMAPDLLSRLEPGRIRRSADEGPPQDAPSEGIRVVNGGRARVVITAHGVPIGWVEPGATGHFVGLRPGPHLIAGMRPLGNLGWRPREVRLPAEIAVR